MRKAAIFLAATLWASGVIAADSPKNAKPGKPTTATGVLTENDSKKVGCARLERRLPQGP